MNQILSSLPSAAPLYVKALGTTRRKPQGKPQIPALSATVNGVRADAANLAAYNQICGYAEGETLPLIYPQVMAASMQMHLMAQKDFPLPMLGIVHVRQQITQQRPLRADETFDVVVRTGETRDVRAGLEFDLITDCSIEGNVIWTATCSIIYRMPAPKGGAKPKPATPPAQLAEYASFDVPEDMGRRYARVSGDYNPIHLYPLTAKALGFKRAIAHGLWSLAHSVALVQGQLGREPVALDASFKQPLYLPGRVAVRHRRNADGLEFALLSRNSDVVHLAGVLR